MILCVAGARPNFIKIGPIVAALRARGLSVTLVHTGQHYDAAMNDVFFRDLQIPPPDIALGVGGGSHAVQTGAVMQALDPVLDRLEPAAVLVVGDVNSTLAAALVAAKRGTPVIHVEAGLRSYDRAMPEEINRVLTDQISDLLFTTERGAEANLVREGIDPARIRFVGNVMIDSLEQNRARAVPAAATCAAAGLSGEAVGEVARGFALLTLHRPSNVDDPVALRGLLGAMVEIAERLPVVFPVHPRSAARIAAAGLDGLLAGERIHRLPPVGYLAMLGLMRDARLVLTDSGGVQEETTALGVPCLTLRESTERPVTISEGTNLLVGTDPSRVRAAALEVLASGGKAGRRPELWDGRTAPRIVDDLEAYLDQRRTAA